MSLLESGERAVLWEDDVPGGCHASFRIRRGQGLRLTALGAHANVSMILFNDDDRSERYNMADTLKAQHTAALGAGHVLMSDMGRALAVLGAETVSDHDPICGASSRADIDRSFGTCRFGQARNAMYRSGQEGLLVELAKWGLGKEDLVAPVNFFSALSVDDEGGVALRGGHAQSGDFVECAAVLNLLCVLSTAPHPLAAPGPYAPADIRITVYGAGMDAVSGARHCPENVRALANSHRYLGGS
ncbi:urea amidolyase associated protein UAAP1 [Acidiferrobacter sp.]|uniref:urea amidolyase associated protein UAAP1 n=1 Tax=Acidiferrobacter sp. TaxID=1872107 RepID=UPI002609FBD9|nr:urea amidolyase associated protein UAAP1 [Acidiferrobacter sp.]